MTAADRELLELAAKAAGYTLNEGSRGYRSFLCKGGVEWNPRDDDGDALRLAVRLSLDIQWDHYNGLVICSSSTESPHRLAEVPYGDDGAMALRLAILRAAAEIGRALP